MLNKVDYSYVDLSNSDMSEKEFIECCFNHANLSGSNFANSVMYGSDFEGAKLAGITITMNCKTFKKLKLDDKQVEYLLYLISLADISHKARTAVEFGLTPERKGRLDILFGQD